MSNKIFYTHQFETLLIIALLFTLIGLIVGYFSWRESEDFARKLKQTNELLKKQQKNLIECSQKLSQQASK